MGDAKEAGAEAPQAGGAAREGLSLLSQGESDEPSAQVSPPRDGTCPGLWDLQARSAGEGCHGSPQLLEPSPRLPETSKAGTGNCQVCLSPGTCVFSCKAFVSKATLAFHSVVIDR
jgi:hypothetical protein